MAIASGKLASRHAYIGSKLRSAEIAILHISRAAFGATLFRDLVQITAFERGVDN
jgi:hypothetical protein